MARKVTLKGGDADRTCVENAETGYAKSDPATAPYQFEVNLFELARVIFQKRRLVIGVCFAVMVLTATYLFLQPNLYKSSATILPSGKSNGMSALKSLIGLGDIFVNPDENSSALYPVVLRSNLVVNAVLRDKYEFTQKSQPMQLTLPEYFGIDNRDRLRAALVSATTIKSDQQTGEIHVGVETRYPALSKAILTNYLAQLEDFNRNKRRSSARDNEKYMARQLVAINEELQDAEDKLENFQKVNLNWAGSDSPEILKELGRLQRDIVAKSTTYSLLTQEHEMAKLEAQKDIPIIRILDSPSLPSVKSGPFRRNIIILSGIIAFMMITFIIIVRHLVVQVATGSGQEDYHALQSDLQSSFPRTKTVLNRIRSSVLKKTPLIKS